MRKSILFALSLIFLVSVSLQIIFTNDIGRNVSANAYKTEGSVLNAVVYISFANPDNDSSVKGFFDFDENFFGKMEQMYISSKVSVKNYFLTQSKGKLTVDTTFFGDNNPIVLDNSADYYKPKYEWKDGKYSITANVNGYDNRWYDANGFSVEPGSKNAKESIDGYLREQLLVREVSAKCNVSDYNGDYDRDGKTDSLVFILNSGKDDGSSDWGEILWSHMGVAHDFPQTVLNNYYYTSEQALTAKNLGTPVFGNSTIAKYNFLSAGQICKRKTGHFNVSTEYSEDGELYDVGLLCHEMAHNLGLSDYYSYENPNYESVGEFDVLGNYTPVPQNMLAYIKHKMGWLDFDDILYINSSGTYSLPFSSANGFACAKIVLNDYLSTGEYFIVEARSKDYATADNPFDSWLSGSGLIIYRVAEKNAYFNAKGTLGNTDYGNMFGGDEVYVYRINAKDGSNNKLSQKNILVNYSTALLGSSISSCGVNRFGTKFISDDYPIIYSDGTNSSIVFDNISENKDTSEMSFSVSLPDDPKSPAIALDMSQCKIERYFDGSRRMFWSSNVKDGNAYVIALRSTDRLKRLAETNKANITIEDIKNGRFSYYKTLYSGCAPLAEKNIVLPEFEDNAMIFLAFEAPGGLRTIRYAGEIALEEESISQYVTRIFDPVYLFFVIAAFLLLIVVVVLLITSKKSLKRTER